MHLLLIIAHGSRIEQSNREVCELVTRLRERLVSSQSTQFDAVDYAFLELTSPNISDVIDKSVHSGAQRITLLPYFLTAGRHVTEDIPAEIEQARRRYPEITFQVTPWFGSTPTMPDLLLAFSQQVL